MKKVILLSLVLFAAAMAMAQTDKYLVYDGTDYKIWVFKNTIVKENEYVTFWEEWEYISQEAKNEIINFKINLIKKYEQDTQIDFIEWSKFKSTKEQVCIDMSDRTYNSIKKIYYTNTGEVLDSYKYTTVDWKDIVPESVYESVYEKVCSIVTLNINNK